jgi:hypothetical protein
MELDRAIKTQRHLIVRLRDLASSARLFGLSSDEINKKYNAIIGELPKNTPRHVREYARGYWYCLSDKFYESDLVFGGFVGETFYSTHNDRADYYGKNGIEPSAYADDGKVTRRGHYWKTNLRPYFVR